MQTSRPDKNCEYYNIYCRLGHHSSKQDLRCTQNPTIFLIFSKPIIGPDYYVSPLYPVVCIPRLCHEIVHRIALSSDFSKPVLGVNCKGIVYSSSREETHNEKREMGALTDVDDVCNTEKDQLFRREHPNK